VALVGALVVAVVAPAAAQSSGTSRPPPAPEGAAEVTEAMSRDDPFMDPAHIALTPLRPRTAADSARAAATVRALREALAPFKDVSFAEHQGYQIFAPRLPGQTVYHFNNFAYALASEGYFDPTRPSALLYRKEKSGAFTLVGAMYTAGADLPIDSLDSRVPLSVARWHRHINFCIPPRRDSTLWRATRNGKPIFGPQGVSTRADCEAAGGRFVEQLFGWMVHVRPFDSDDPYVAFGAMHQHDH